MTSHQTTTQQTSSDRPGLAPLIMTAILDHRSWTLFQGLRERHFPAELNRVPAHVTLFHHLRGEEFRTIAERVERLCATTTPLPFTVNETRFLGRGVALALRSPPLVVLRDGLAAGWRDDLTSQDRQGYKPHVTIQNKVMPEAARATQALLSALLPIEGTIDGLQLWHYRGGPWEPAGRYRFAT